MIIWIASYPKSGNTWVRSFLSSYIYKNAKSFNFSDLEKIRAFPSDLEINFLRKKYGKYKFTHMAEHWDIFQKNIINKNKYTFLKTHNALVNIKNFSFTNLNNTLGLIYIIRDPRDVAISYSSHLNLNLKNTINHMQNINLTEKTPDNLDRTLITSWSNHYNSWNLLPKKKIVIRYEDLIDNPESSFLKILQYLNKIIPINVDKKLITQTIKLVNFNKLKLLESENGFIENKSPKKNHKFFKEGKKKQWMVNLPINLQDKIKKMFEKEMFENKYIV